MMLTSPFEAEHNIYKQDTLKCVQVLIYGDGRFKRC